MFLSERTSVSREALDDYYHGDGSERLEVFRAHRQSIENLARLKYLSDKSELDGTLLVCTAAIPY